MCQKENYLPRILLVEDSEPEARLFTIALEDQKLPFEVVWAHTYWEAIGMLSQIREQSCYPKIIFLDLMLAGHDGVDLLKYIRIDLQLEIPVIIISGSEKPLDKQRSLENGANEYVMKCIDFDHYAQNIVTVLSTWIT